LKLAIEIVDIPIENGGSFHSYVSLPEGIICCSYGVDFLCLNSKYGVKALLLSEGELVFTNPGWWFQ
jgi:hypothetical protein